MNYNEQKTEERLRNVPREHRVFIYNASIIIEFLSKTLMPLPYFIKANSMQKLMSGESLIATDYNRESDYENESLTIGELYDFYKMFRQQSDYTTPIESRYKFSVILSKLDYIKNGWQFEKRRVGRAQLIFLRPAQIRVRVPEEVRKQYPPGPANLSKGQIGMTMGDMTEGRGISPLAPKKNVFTHTIKKGDLPTSTTRKLRITKVDARKWKEAKYWIEVKIEPKE